MQSIENDEQFMSGGGQMGALIRSMDWSKTALGPVHEWPQSLRTSVSLCLSSTFPILIAWGPELIQIYNDSYRPICGAKHPQSMGENFKICWETALPVVGDAFDRGLAGEGTYIKDQQMLLDRYGYIEEAFMTFSFAPIRDESGNVGGIFHPITETTDQILSARRTQVLRDLSVQTGDVKSFEEIFSKLITVHEGFTFDVPFLQVYEINHSTNDATLKIAVGTNDNTLEFPHINFADTEKNRWPFELTPAHSFPIQVENLTERFGSFQSGPFDLAPQTALIYPITIAGHELPYGFLVVGVSSGRALDQEYQNFFALFSNTVSTAFSNVDAYQQQQKRAQQLAEIDRAKTAFFSNVSHEFRTPLTLILGPLQQLNENPTLDGRLSLDNRESMYRNAQRLLKLVNNLLDFSRMEAGRVKASYEKVRLSELTTDLASNFRSVIESAGMQLITKAEDTEIEAYVDTDMWEKIVLNLLSNAFKYTLAGSITVEIKEEGNWAVLAVTDTGVGIPENELPHMFERFHRVENSLGRTHEGTGIGLSLVAELVNLHFGQLSVSSVFGEGSTFFVKLPLGSGHLPKEQIIESKSGRSNSSQQETFIREAMSLLDRQESVADTEHYVVDQEIAVEVQKHVRVMVVDDNADMRTYLGKLISPYFEVELALNGQDALDKITANRPDVIVSDVMMPVMDGQQLVKELRSKPGPRIPVILLSARAGEEARVEGLGWGADDYLVKPFSARELLSKVNSVVQINHITRKTEAELRNIFLHAPVAIAILKGKQLTIEVANQMMLQYWGKSGENIIGIPFLEAFDQFPGKEFDSIAKEVVETGERKVIHEWPLALTRNGSTSSLYLNMVFEPLHDVTGVTNGVMVVSNDVTELIKALEHVRESEQRFKLLANSTPQLIWRIDKTGGPSFYNEFTLKYSGLTKEELQQNRLISIVHPDEREQNLAQWEHSMNTGEDFIYEHRYRRHDGQYRWHLSRGIAQRGASGEIENWVGASTDIHDQKTLEETLESRVSLRTAELKTINEQLRKTNRELEQFAHVTSHDLQEPLRKIQVFSELVQQNIPEIDQTTRNYLNRIIASSERMSLLIKDLLSFAQIASSDEVFEATDLNEILSRVKEDFEFLSEEKNAVITSDDLPIIQAIPLQMNQLFSNLLGNGLKFSGNNARITISSKFITKQKSANYQFLEKQTEYVKITFKDNGIGFDQEFADRIFTIFQRLHTDKDFEGTGIGLSICKRIVDNHAGYIHAHGETGVGASFEVYIPTHHRSLE